mmetsp:Transcript_41041/g.41924  ORF Transcript_41041/g.41924 Transcript_41041/m.41924 type:complete len:357 (-) Transcript_41041:2-1072(-)
MFRPRLFLERRRLNMTKMMYKASRTASIRSLIIGEHNGSDLTPATLSTITAASQIGQDTTLLIVGHDIDHLVAKSRNINILSNILTVRHEIFTHPVAEDISHTVLSVLANQPPYTHILAASSPRGKDVLPRVAAVSDSSPVTDVTAVLDPSTVCRPMYAGSTVATVTMTDPVKFLLVRGTSFQKTEIPTSSSDAHTDIPFDTAAVTVQDLIFKESQMKANLSCFVSSESNSNSSRPELTSARVVVAGGRALGSAEGFLLLDALAERLDGAVGATRAAVDAGYVPNELQVGQTGKCVAPDLYLAIGISGAIQHLSGIKDSKTIVAINKDKDAPIFQVADYGLVGDLFDIVPELTSKV